MLPAPRIETVLAAAARVHRRRGDRRPQRPLRPRRSSTPRSSAPAGPRLANRAVDTCALARRLVRDEVPELPARHARQRASGLATSRPTARSTTRCATADLLHLLLERAGGASACSASTTCSRCPASARHPQAAKLRLTDAPAPHAGRLPVPRRGGRRAVRRQGHQPAPAGALVLLERRSPQGRPAAARDAADRPYRVHGPARGGGARGAADPRAPAPVQPSRQAVAASTRT